MKLTAILKNQNIRTMETKPTIEIDEESLRETLRDALKESLDFEWSGWRIPLYVDGETGEVTSGSWLSNNSWQPDTIELPRIAERWTLEEGQDFDYIVEEIIDHYIEKDLFNNWEINYKLI